VSKNGVNLATYFMPYQARLIRDCAKRVLVEKGRRTGFTYAVSYKIVEDLIDQCERPRERPRCDWWFSSADETAAKEFIEYVAFWVREIFNVAAVTIGAETLRVSDKDIQVQVVRFPNGAKCTALASNPKAMRSKGGNLVLDEFAFHDDPRGMWAAASKVPKWGGQMIVISTHNGEGTVFHQQCQRARQEADRLPPDRRLWSWHYCSLDTAIGDGLVEKIRRLERPATPEEKAAFRQECRDDCLTEEEFQQEYLCMPAAAAAALLPYEMIEACEDGAADFLWNPLRQRMGPNYAGTDVGRTHDLTVTWDLERAGDVLWTREILVLDNVKFRLQREAISGLYRRAAVAGANIDGFGIGMQLAEDLIDEFGALRIASVQVNTTNLVLMATRVKSLFEDRTIRIPRDPALREALHKPRKIEGLGGTRIKLARDASGHCDEFVALGLAGLRAFAGGEVGPIREGSYAGRPCQGALVGAAASEGGLRW
jgi:phage FluMu gp28-like protein